MRRSWGNNGGANRATAIARLSVHRCVRLGASQRFVPGMPLTLDVEMVGVLTRLLRGTGCSTKRYAVLCDAGVEHRVPSRMRVVGTEGKGV